MNFFQTAAGRRNPHRLFARRVKQAGHPKIALGDEEYLYVMESILPLLGLIHDRLAYKDPQGYPKDYLRFWRVEMRKNPMLQRVLTEYASCFYNS